MRYLDRYQLENRLNSDSEVLERALRALRELELTAAYSISLSFELSFFASVL